MLTTEAPYRPVMGGCWNPLLWPLDFGNVGGAGNNMGKPKTSGGEKKKKKTKNKKKTKKPNFFFFFWQEGLKQVPSAWQVSAPLSHIPSPFLFILRQATTKLLRQP